MARAIGWDISNQEVQCHSVLKPNIQYSLPYDKLVISVGMLPNTYGIKGVEEYAFFLKVRCFKELQSFDSTADK